MWQKNTVVIKKWQERWEKNCKNSQKKEKWSKSVGKSEK